MPFRQIHYQRNQRGTEIRHKYGVLCTMFVITVLCGDIYTASTPPFKCVGSEDVCNVYDVDQYCGRAPGGKRCISCAHIRQSCGKSDMPLACYNDCMQREVADALQFERERSCPPVQEVLNANHNGTQANYTVGEVVLFTCIHTHYMVGFDTIICQEYGLWSSNVPRCHETICPKPVTPKNGHVMVTPRQKRYHVGSTINFECNTGYVLHGPSTASCGSDGRWNFTEMFSCQKEICCTIPPRPMYGVVRPQPKTELSKSLPVGSNITFDCEEGFTMKGEQVWICRSNGTWNHDQMISCYTSSDEGVIRNTAVITACACGVLGLILVIVRKCLCKTRRQQYGVRHKRQNITEMEEESLKDSFPKNETEQALDIEMEGDTTNVRQPLTNLRINSFSVNETEKTRPEGSRKKLEQSQSFDGQNLANPTLAANRTQSSGFESCSTNVDSSGSSRDELPSTKDGSQTFNIQNFNFTIGDNNINTMANGKSTAHTKALEKEMNARNPDNTDASDNDSDGANFVLPEQETGITVEPRQPAMVDDNVGREEYQ